MENLLECAWAGSLLGSIGALNWRQGSGSRWPTIPNSQPTVLIHPAALSNALTTPNATHDPIENSEPTPQIHQVHSFQ